MRTTWSRELIIRHILEREAKGHSFTIGGDGIDPLLYSATRRIFGSWRNAILAAGIPPERILSGERWSPTKILAQIRVLSRRRRPLTTRQMETQYQNLVSAARRHFGSWSKAIVVAGVDPVTVRRGVVWNRERVIEAILTRALRGQSLVARLIEPRSLTTAGHRLFGSWRAAVAAAGLDPSTVEMPPRRKKRPSTVVSTGSPDCPGSGYQTWNKERVIECIQKRLRENRPIHASAVIREYPRLYAAANRHLRNWDEAMKSAGVDPASHRRKRPASRGISSPPATQPDGDDAVTVSAGE